MATDEQKLSGEQRELVAVGASVGAGCHPCVSYHIKAGTQAGLAGGRLLGAVTSGERVAGEAAERMAVHARAELGTQGTEPGAVSPLDDALASFGAALAANDLVNIERQMQAAAEAGASRWQLQEALEVAQNVQQNAARIHFEKAERLLETSSPPPAAPSGGCDDDCPCHADADTDAPSDAETEVRPAGDASGRPVEANRGQASGRAASSAGPIADVAEAAGAGTAAGRFAMMGDCRAMLGACAEIAAAGAVDERSEASLTTAGSTREA